MFECPECKGKGRGSTPASITHKHTCSHYAGDYVFIDSTKTWEVQEV